MVAFTRQRSTPYFEMPPSPSPTLVVLSHLRWDFVYQRPQHLLSRLGARRPVLFVEEPIHDPEATTPWVERRVAAPGVEVIRPHTALAEPGFSDAQLATMADLMPEILGDHASAERICWLYTPLALPLVDAIDPSTLVYDCMDELSAFRFAPPALLQREAELLRRADLVLTGGPSLYEARKDRHPNVHCFPSSVDAKHFAPRPIPADDAAARSARSLHAPTRPPRFGFFGVIDERMDLELIAAVADRFPEAHVAMVGPVVKIDPAALPQRPNLHWLGQQPYEVLPRLVADWQVCLMPFALNESTRFISPTKTLEYLAAGKPVVSTAVHDVEVLYGDVVRIGHDHAEFLDGCAAALAETLDERRAGQRAGEAAVKRSSWDETARRIGDEIDACRIATGDRSAVASGHGAPTLARSTARIA